MSFATFDFGGRTVDIEFLEVEEQGLIADVYFHFGGTTRYLRVPRLHFDYLDLHIGGTTLLQNIRPISDEDLLLSYMCLCLRVSETPSAAVNFD